MALSQQNSEYGCSYLVFSLARARFAIDVAAVREIIWLPELMPIEETPEHIVGVVNLRGQIIPVMDLVLRFGHPRKRYNRTDKVIVLEAGQSIVGIISNEVHDVLPIGQAYIQKPAKNKHYTVGEAMVEDAIIMLLDQQALCDFDITAAAQELLAEAHEHPNAESSIEQGEYFCPEADEESRNIFRQRALELIRAPADKTKDDHKLLAVVELGSELYGVDLNLVREFSEIGRITPVPCTPSYIIGDMNLRGEVLTLLDIRESLGMQVTSGANLKKLIVVKAGGLTLGVPVEKIDALIYLQPEDILPLPSQLDATREEHLSGTAQYGEKLLGILDLETILQNNELVVNEDV